MIKILMSPLFSILFSTSALAATHSSGGHLAFDGGRIHTHLSWIQEPSTDKEARMKLEWRDGATHKAMEPGLAFRVDLFMPDMGHGSAPTQIAPWTDENGQAALGAYQISNMYFMMAGSWEVRVTLTYADGSTETQAWSLDVP